MSVRMQLIPLLGFAIAGLLALGGARYASESAQASARLGGTVYWSDGASGRLSDGTRFRLEGVSVPAIGPLHEREGARCETERRLGFEARRIATDLTRGHEVVVTGISGRDRLGRNIVTLSLGNRDLADMLAARGLHHYDPVGSDAAIDWCVVPAV